MEVQPYYIVKINLALWRVLDMKVRESAAFRKRIPSAERRVLDTRTNLWGDSIRTGHNKKTA